MIFAETRLKGIFVIELKKIEDDRGFFARAWCRKEFEEHGLNPNFVQANNALSHRKNTLRGLHFQVAPDEEAKLIRCIQGAIFDVVVDLRPASSTYKQWFGIELSMENRKMLYVSENFAHGYVSLKDNTEVFYLVSHYYSPDSEKGYCWDDPAFGIQWPVRKDLIVSEKDRQWPMFSG